MNDSHFAIVHEHHHVTDAGMRSVIDTLTMGLQRQKPEIIQYLWYSPHKYHSGRGPEETYPSHGLHIMEDRELGYLEKKFNSASQFTAHVQRRREAKTEVLGAILERHGTVVHLIQNPTLLKNPVETQANAAVARNLMGHRYLQIWHIHDLLEDGAARAPLRAHIKTLCGPETERLFGVNGSGIGWSTAPNIFYAVINTRAQRAIRQYLLPEIRQVVFYLPDAIDVAALQASGTGVSDAVIDDLLERFCRTRRSEGYTFDRDAELLIAAEMARERKNTGEQILILNMLNAMGAQTGRSFQLLVTMLPQHGHDRRRIESFNQVIRKNRLPVVMGFGPELISRGTDREPGKFTLTELWRHQRALAELSTAVTEGFGLNFICPAAATAACAYTLPTVGRRIDGIFPDFEAAGLIFPRDAYYDALLMDASILRDDVCCEAARIIGARPAAGAAVMPDGRRVDPVELGRDFALYPAEAQALLLDCIDYRKLGRRHRQFVDCLLNRGQMNAVAKHNAGRVERHFSQPAYIERLLDMIGRAFALKARRLQSGEQPGMIRDNSGLAAFLRGS